MFLIATLQALYGFSIPLSKILLNYAAPFFTSSLRMLGAGIVLLCIERFYNKKKLMPAITNIQLQLYALTLYLKYMMRAHYVQHLSCIRMGFLFNLGPFIAAFLSYMYLSERLSARQWLGMCIGCVASMWYVIESNRTALSESFYISTADIILLLAMVINFYGLIIKKRLLTQNNMSVSAVNGTAAVASGALGLATSFNVEGLFPVTHIGYFTGWFTVLFMLSNIVCRNLYAFLLKRYSVTFLSLADFLMNMCTALYGWLLFNETITVAYLVSSACVCLGLYIFYRDEIHSVHTPIKTTNSSSTDVHAQ
jgi:drug/metabolite transporter (DMT)-like permease